AVARRKLFRPQRQSAEPRARLARRQVVRRAVGRSRKRRRHLRRTDRSAVRRHVQEAGVECEGLRAEYVDVQEADGTGFAVVSASVERRPLRPSVLARIGGRERPPLHWFFVIKFLERCRTMKSIFEGKNILVLERDDWEFVERKKGKDAVAVIAETEDGELILTEQFRRPVNARVIDFPAGLVEDDGPEATAKKELEEETGYTCDSVELLAKGPTSPGITSEIVSIYRAHGVRRVG